jgi:PleD family two-component response regulator
MVLVVVDDLMFSSKIRVAAEHVGADVRFVRSRAEAVIGVRSEHPSLVILDLGAVALEPLGLIADLKADPTTHGVPLVGFVRHTDADTIAAARSAGIDTVMARSGFVTALPGLLASGAGAPTRS